MKVLIVAPKFEDIDTLPELSSVASGNEPIILQGRMVTAALFDRTVEQEDDVEIVHLITHGTYGLVEFSDEPRPAESLARAMCNLKQLKAVVLNSCKGAGTAAILHRALSVPVIAHERPIADPAALTFATELYRGLAKGITLGQAFDEARACLSRVHPDQGDIPILLNGDAHMHDITARLDSVERICVDMNERLVEVEHRNKSWQGWLLPMVLLTNIAVIVIALLR